MTLEAAWLLLTVAGGGVLVEGVTKLLARVHPPSYFGVSELIRGFSRDISWYGLLVRLAIPFACGAVVGFLNPEYRGTAGAGAAALGALLVIWPPMVHEDLLPYGAMERQTEVRIVYVLYFVSYLLLGLAGGSSRMQSRLCAAVLSRSATL